jgi:hypothetical protein
MRPKNKAFGYYMTFRQAAKLSKLLTEDIIERYDHPEYHNPSIVEMFAHNNHLEQAE